MLQICVESGAEVTRAGCDGANGGDGIVEGRALDGGDHPRRPDEQAYSEEPLLRPGLSARPLGGRALCCPTTEWSGTWAMNG